LASHAPRRAWKQPVRFRPRRQSNGVGRFLYGGLAGIPRVSATDQLGNQVVRASSRTVCCLPTTVQQENPMTPSTTVTKNSGLKVVNLMVTKEGKIERRMPNLSPQAQLNNTLLEALCPG